MLEGIIVTDESLKIVFSNYSAKNLLGISTNKNITDMLLLDIIRDNKLKRTIEFFKKTYKTVTNLEMSIDHPIERFININILPIRDEENNVLSIIFIINDITERSRLERQKIQSEKLSSLAALMSGVAHEIKNPLNSLNIHIHLIRRSISEAQNSKKTINLDRFIDSINIIEEEIKRLGNVVDDFLQAARPTSPQFELKSMNQIIYDVISIISPEARERNITITTQLEQNSPYLYIDPNQIKQALINVVRNSIEAINPAKDGFITVRTHFDESAVYITVTDNGCGIAEEDYIKVFEPYYTTKFSGTGLGLMIVYRIIKEHNGAIDLKSKVGEGTQFTIILPLPQTSPRLLDAVGIQPSASAEDK